jgi:hypothetical protein
VVGCSRKEDGKTPPAGSSSAASTTPTTATSAKPEPLAAGTTVKIKRYSGTEASVKLSAPEGWVGKPDYSGAPTFKPKDATRWPEITVNPGLDSIEPDKLDAEIDKSLDKLKKEVVGGGKVKVLAETKLPNGKAVAIHVDAKKEREIEYLQMTCYVRKVGEKFAVRIEGTASPKDEKSLATFEAACKSAEVP